MLNNSTSLLTNSDCYRSRNQVTNTNSANEINNKLKPNEYNYRSEKKVTNMPVEIVKDGIITNFIKNTKDEIRTNFIKNTKPYKEDNPVIYQDFIEYSFNRRVAIISGEGSISRETHLKNTIKILSFYSYENILLYLNNSNFIDSMLTTQDKNLYNQLVYLLSDKITNESLTEEQNNIVINIANKIATKITNEKNANALISINSFYKLLYLISCNYENINTVTLILFNMLASRNSNTFFNVTPSETGEISNNYFDLLNIIAHRERFYEIPKIVTRKGMNKNTTKLIKSADENNNFSYVLMKNIIPHIKGAIKVKYISEDHYASLALAIAKIIMNFKDHYRDKIVNKLIKDKTIDSKFKEILETKLRCNRQQILNENYDKILFTPPEPCTYSLTYNQMQQIDSFDNPIINDSIIKSRLSRLRSYDTCELFNFFTNNDFIQHILSSKNLQYLNDIIDLIFIKTANTKLTEKQFVILHDLCRYIFITLDHSGCKLPNFYGKLYQILAIFIPSNQNALISLLNERLDRGNINGCFDFNITGDKKIVCGYMSLLLLLTHSMSTSDKKLVGLIEKSAPYINRAINTPSYDKVQFWMIYLHFITINFSIEQKKEFNKILPLDKTASFISDLCKTKIGLLKKALKEHQDGINRFRIQDIVTYHSMFSIIIDVDNIIDQIDTSRFLSDYNHQGLYAIYNETYV